MNSVYTYQPTQLADAHCHALKSKNLPHLDFFEMFKKWRSRSFFQRISENLIFYEVEENLIIKFLQIISSHFKIFLSVQAEIMFLCPLGNFLLLCIIANQTKGELNTSCFPTILEMSALSAGVWVGRKMPRTAVMYHLDGKSAAMKGKMKIYIKNVKCKM